MAKRWILLMLSCFLLLALAGCVPQAQEAAPKEKTAVTLPYPKALEKYGITGSVTLAKKPERVVALTNTPVLTLHALGVNLVGIPATKIVQWPEDLKQHAKEFQTGMRSNIDLEGVIALQPDLVIVGYHARDTYGKILEREKIPVYYVDAGPTVSYDSIKELTLILVDAFGKESEAGMKIKERFQQVEKEMENARQQNQGKKVMVLQAAPPRFYLQNKNGTVGSMLQLLGFTNVAPEMGGSMVPMDQEKALSYQLDLVVCVSAMAGENEQQEAMEQEFRDHASYWDHFTAIREGQVIYLPKWFAVSGGLDELDQIQDLIRRLDSLKEGKA